MYVSLLNRSLKNLGLANNEISSLPDTLLDSSVQLYTMDISGNQFDYLPKIPQTVASVHARSGKLKVINESSLREAEMLEYLDVSGNTIYIIEENAFSGARNLQVLTMAVSEFVLSSTGNIYGIQMRILYPKAVMFFLVQ